MATAKQIAANRRNAQKSTGPKSPEGKAIVSQNRMTHGLCARFSVLPEIEKQENYDTLLERFMEAEQPVDQVEVELVVKMAQSTWLSSRAVRSQNDCFVPMPKTPEQIKAGETPMGITDSLELAMRYHAAHDRAYQRASAELQKRKKERRLAEIGFESQERKRNQEARAQAEEIRKAEKHAVANAIATMRKQREEMRLGDQIAKMLPPDFNLNDLNSIFNAGGPAEKAAYTR